MSHDLKPTRPPAAPLTVPAAVRGRGARSARFAMAVVVTWMVAGVLSLGVAGVASAAVIHKLLPGPTEAISREVKTCNPGPGTVTGPLGTFGKDMMTVDEGDLWFGDTGQGGTGLGGGARMDELNAETGACTQQLKYPDGEEVEFYVGGVAVGHSTGSREVYAGLSEYVAGGKRVKNVVTVFGSSGLLEGVWAGANTPEGVFREAVTGVAVDEDHTSMEDWASGDVLVGSEGSVAHSGVVDVLKPVAGGAEPSSGDVRTLEGTCPTVGTVCSGAQVIPFGSVDRIAVDQQNGELFVVASEFGKPGTEFVDMFLPVGIVGEYEYLGRLGAPGGGVSFPGVESIAVDGGAPDGGDIYLISENVVEELSVASGKLLGRITGTSEGPFAKALAVAVDPVSHHVYVGDAHSEKQGEGPSAIDVFGEDLVVPDVAVTGTSEVGAFTAVLHGSVNPDGAGEAGCEFEYGTSLAYGQRSACTKRVPNGSGAVPVQSKELEGLEPGTTYYYRLAANNANGANQGECPEDCGQFTTRGPRVVSTSVAGVTATSATLHAAIDPNGVATSYFFEYGREGGGFESPVPAYPGSALGAGGEAMLAPGVPVSDLAPEAVYRYRVVAVSEVEVTPGRVETHEFDGPEESFTTQGAGHFTLPDDRQWQLVSPPDKHGALLESINESTSNGSVIQAAVSGDAITYVASAPTEAAPVGNSNLVQVLSTRGSDGWSSRDLTLPHLEATDGSVGPGNEYRFFSEDLSRAIVQPFGAFDPAVSEEASESAPLLHSDFSSGNVTESCTSRCYRPLVTGCPSAEEEAKGHVCPVPVRAAANVPAGTRFGEFGGRSGPVQEPGETCPPELMCGPQFKGAAPDAEHVVLDSSVALTETAIPDELNGGESLYEWSAESRRLELVSVLPEEGGEPERPAVSAELGGPSIVRDAISSDGSRVFFTTNGNGGLYMRDTSLHRTVRLDLPEAGCDTCEDSANAQAQFQFATSGGSQVLFTDTQRLTANATRENEGGDGDLYECAIVVLAGVPRCELSDLTPKGASGEAAGVQGKVIGASEDGSWLYFVANGVFAPGAVRGDCNNGLSPTNECNLYVRHEGQTRLVAVLSQMESVDWGTPGAGSAALDEMLARVSPNGEWLAFMSERDLTGYDSEDVSSARTGETLDEEVYLYDARTGSLACASCIPTGARPIGEESVRYEPEEATNMPLLGSPWHDYEEDGRRRSPSLAADVPGWTEYRLSASLHQPRYLSDSGRLFFDARDGLVPDDVNGSQPGGAGWDVYEYEPEGVGEAVPCSPAAQSGSVVFKPAHAFTNGDGVAGEEQAGCVGLISSGESSAESAFLDASETGGDVFFLTAARLVPGEDYDSNYDVYDAHECTGASPCLPEPAAQPPVCATADECRAAPAPQPEVFGAPASATFSGLGDSVSSTAAPPPSTVKPAPKPLTKAQRLKAALQACRKDRKKPVRTRCEASARRRYGAAKPKAKGGGARAKRSSTADRGAGR